MNQSALRHRTVFDEGNALFPAIFRNAGNVTNRPVCMDRNNGSNRKIKLLYCINGNAHGGFFDIHEHGLIPRAKDGDRYIEADIVRHRNESV